MGEKRRGRLRCGPSEGQEPRCFRRSCDRDLEDPGVLDRGLRVLVAAAAAVGEVAAVDDEGGAEEGEAQLDEADGAKRVLHHAAVRWGTAVLVTSQRGSGTVFARFGSVSLLRASASTFRCPGTWP